MIRNKEMLIAGEGAYILKKVGNDLIIYRNGRKIVNFKGYFKLESDEGIKMLELIVYHLKKATADVLWPDFKTLVYKKIMMSPDGQLRTCFLLLPIELKHLEPLIIVLFDFCKCSFYVANFCLSFLQFHLSCFFRLAHVSKFYICFYSFLLVGAKSLDFCIWHLSQ